MDERNKLVVLYDYYGELLNDSQKKYFEDYYFNNLSLGEIAEEEKISRNAVHKQIKSAQEKLEFYDSKLKLIEKEKEILETIKDDNLKERITKIIES
ncbi:MAG: DNA-binding protein [Bacilli bacterium]|nr:DNA-binding protein [Bacilli bacterium]